jgi:hypothetical protein
MLNRIKLIVVAILGSLVSWKVVDLFLINLPLWKYLIIEGIVLLSKTVYEKEKKRLSSVG